MATLGERRSRAKSLATRIVSVAIMAVGSALLLAAIVLPLRGGLGFIFIAILLAGAGLLALLGGFFFNLVPYRLQELEDEKRAFDAREREGARDRERRDN